jgi:hypothetical protein
MDDHLIAVPRPRRRAGSYAQSSCRAHGRGHRPRPGLLASEITPLVVSGLATLAAARDHMRRWCHCYIEYVYSIG